MCIYDSLYLKYYYQRRIAEDREFNVIAKSTIVINAWYTNISSTNKQTTWTR